MRKYRKWSALILVLFLLLRLLPGFARAFGSAVSLPLLRLLAKAGDCFPFVLLEWVFLGICALLLAALLRRRFLRRLLCTLLSLASLYLILWYPLYFAVQPEYRATPAEIAASCEKLIGTMNASPPDFSEMPELPAKRVRFPGWMRLLNISGICAFPTGEALVSPDLPDCALPFVAVHERMHLEGIAGEGAANIAAWQECMRLGGAFADSARLWGIRYCMGFLRSQAPALYERCMDGMEPRTLHFYREAGGAYNPSPQSRLEIALGIAGDYEILAHYLAAEGA